MIDSKLNGYVSQDTFDLKLSSRLKSYVERQSFESALANETYTDSDSLKSIISEKLKSYVTRSSFDDVITMFAEDVNNMTMGVTILRSDMESEFENLFNELIFFKKVIFTTLTRKYIILRVLLFITQVILFRKYIIYSCFYRG